MISRFFQKIIGAVRCNYRHLRLRISIKHVFGPKKINYGKNELVVVCLVYNSEACIKQFIEHYFSLGARHIVFLDNNSKDSTVEKVREMALVYKNITLLKSNFLLRKDEDEYHFKNYLVNRFCKNRWGMCADADEFFDWPYSDVIGLRSLLDYLNANRYNAVVTQMLDMFSDKPLNKLEKLENEKKLVELYDYYDISSIRKENLLKTRLEIVGGNIISNSAIKFYLGGIRKKVFNTDNFITKYSLFFLDKNIRLQPHSHFVGNARIADFSTVLYHYKFNKDFYKSSLTVVQTKAFPSCLNEYESYVNALDKKSSITLKQETSKKLKSTYDLVENKFLVVSENYKNYAMEIGKKE